jgi:hypothetical protein
MTSPFRTEIEVEKVWSLLSPGTTCGALCATGMNREWFDVGRQICSAAVDEDAAEVVHEVILPANGAR